MNGIIQQLELNQSFFIQFALIAVTFLILGNSYFRPFQKLIELRHKRLVEDREAAEKLMAQADAKFEEYRDRLAEERQRARAEVESVLLAAKREEAQILGAAREEARKITQQAAESAQQQQEKLKAQLEMEVEGLANAASEILLVRRN